MRRDARRLRRVQGRGILLSGEGRGRELVELQHTLYTSRNPTRRALHLTRRAWVEAALRRLAGERPSGAALEVGPGGGIYLPLLCELYDSVTASDVEDSYLDHAREAHRELPNLRLAVDDIGASELPGASFDLVLCSEVIEHTPDPAAALAGIATLLRPGGVLLLSTPQPASPLELLGRVAFRPGVIRIVRAVYREPILPPGHVSLLGASRLRAMLEGQGMVVLEHDVSGLYLPAVAELGGEAGLRLQRRLEQRIRPRPRLRGMLWTQYWIAEKPAA